MARHTLTPEEAERGREQSAKLRKARSVARRQRSTWLAMGGGGSREEAMAILMQIGRDPKHRPADRARAMQAWLRAERELTDSDGDIKLGNEAYERAGAKMLQYQDDEAEDPNDGHHRAEERRPERGEQDPPLREGDPGGERAAPGAA